MTLVSSLVRIRIWLIYLDSRSNTSKKRLGLVTAVSKISNAAVIHLSPKQVQFIVINDVTDGFQVWSGMNVVRDAIKTTYFVFWFCFVADGLPPVI